jgi:hypothetical protein
MAVQPVPFLSPEEYLRRERAAEYKSEYYNGQAFAMSGASREHNLIGAARGGLRAGDVRGSSNGGGAMTWGGSKTTCGGGNFCGRRRQGWR